MYEVQKTLSVNSCCLVIFFCKGSNNILHMQKKIRDFASLLILALPGLPSSLLAEREGFEPPEPLSSTVFKTAAIDHSAISPSVECACRTSSKSAAKVLLFFETAKYLGGFSSKKWKNLFIPSLSVR